MSLDTTVPLGRRALLGASLGAAAALVASSLEPPAVVRAGSDGDIVLGDVNYSGVVTSIINPGSDSAVISAANYHAGTAIVAQSVTGDGVDGLSTSGRGVSGSAKAGQGVWGEATTGTGVHASATTGTALDVVGKARFSRSGRAKVLAGRGRVDVNLTQKGALAGTPLIYATLQTYRSGIYVAGVRPNYPKAGWFRIYLNKTLTSAAYVAWFVLS